VSNVTGGILSKESLAIRARFSYIAAFAGIGAALYYILLWLPGVPVPGLPQIKMEIGASLAPLLGIILGPYIGAIAVLVGNIIKSLTPFNPISLVFVPCAPLSAFGAALLITKKWKISFIILIGIMIASLFMPPFYPVTAFDEKLGMYVWQVYLLAFYDKIAALVLTPIAMDLIQSNTKLRKGVGLFLIMFIGRELDKALGCFIAAIPAVYENVFMIKSLRRIRLAFVTPAIFSPIEYLIEAVIVFVIAIPVIRALLKVPGVSETLYIKNVREQKII